MKKSLAFLAVFGLIGLGAVSAQTLQWVGNGYLILNITNAGNSYFDLDGTGNPDFDSDNSSANAYSLTIQIPLGGSILLGGENQTWEPVFGTSSFIGWRVTTNMTTGTEPYSELQLPYWKTESSNDWWIKTNSLPNIVSGLGVGTYYLEVYQHANNGAVDVYGNEGGTGGNNWEARIIIIPEPSTMVLVGLGLAGAWALRRRK